jgi:hypothetical protein
VLYRMFHSCSVLLTSEFQLLRLYTICACSEPKLAEGHGRGDRGEQAGVYGYLS